MSETWDMKTWLVLGILIGGLAGFLLFSNHTSQVVYDTGYEAAPAELTGLALFTPQVEIDCQTPVSPGTNMNANQLRNWFGYTWVTFIFDQVQQSGKPLTYPMKYAVIAAFTGYLKSQSDATVWKWTGLEETNGCDVPPNYNSKWDPWKLLSK